MDFILDKRYHKNKTQFKSREIKSNSEGFRKVSLDVLGSVRAAWKVRAYL